MGDPLKFLDTMSHDLAMAAAEEEASKPAPVATPTPDIDPEEVRRACDEQEKWDRCEPLTYGKATRAVLTEAAREYLRLREQPAPGVQAQIDAAVARERERITELVEIKRAKFNIGTRASLALSDVLDQIRARSGAKGE